MDVACKRDVLGAGMSELRAGLEGECDDGTRKLQTDHGGEGQHYGESVDGGADEEGDEAEAEPDELVEDLEDEEGEKAVGTIGGGKRGAVADESNDDRGEAQNVGRKVDDDAEITVSRKPERNAVDDSHG